MSNPKYTRSQRRVSASASPRYALLDFFNLMMLLAMGTVIVTGIRRLIISGFDPFAGGLVILIAGAMAFFVWALLSLSIDITPEEVNYRSVFRKLTIVWKDVEVVRTEERFSLVTFWVKGRKKRISINGLSPEDKTAIYTAIAANREAFKTPAE